MTYRTGCCVHPNEWSVIASSDLLYITDAAGFEDDLSFSKRTAGWHECPEQYDERTCWSTSDSFVLFLTLPALLIHFPPFTPSPLILVFLPHLCSSLVLLIIFSLLLFFLCNYRFFKIYICLSTFTDSHSISFPIFPLFWLATMLYLLSPSPAVFPLFLFLLSERWGFFWKGHRGKFILDGLPVHAVCLDSTSGWFSVTSQF